MSGAWYTYLRGGDSADTGIDRYVFERKNSGGGGGGTYRILRNGKQGDPADEFTLDDKATTIRHAQGPTAEVQANGDLFWDLEGGKYASRKGGSGASSAMFLVLRGSSNQCVFSCAAALKAGKAAPLTLSSHGSIKGVGRKYAEERRAGPWRYTESACVDDVARAVSVRFEDGAFLVLQDADLVLDVTHWKFEEGTTVNFVGGTSKKKKTRIIGGGRDWVINGDGTISVKKHSHLVLGANAQ